MDLSGRAGRYGIFVVGLLNAALGISLITHAGMGTSPITSPAYVLSLLFPLSLGVFTFLINSTMFLAQIAISNEPFEKGQLLQLPATFLFSAFIDLFTFLLRYFPVSSYPSRMLALLPGCVVLGFGVALEVLADVLILPGEGLVKVISKRFCKDFGTVKTLFDLSLVCIAFVIALVGMGKPAGIGAGTLVAAMTVGSFSRFFKAHLAPLLGRQASCREGKTAVSHTSL